MVTRICHRTIDSHDAVVGKADVGIAERLSATYRSMSVNGTIGACLQQRVMTVRLRQSRCTYTILLEQLAIVSQLSAIQALNIFDELTGRPAAIYQWQHSKPPILCHATSAEQRAIAGALGDVDALLGALEQLIAKKRDLKQAAMQQLLTGQTRLPGFSGEWEVKRLGDVGVRSSRRN